ncbi:MAG: hypothetical protein A3J07_00285 [Candidatus Doudnabacteria bacterium RIFCSPLOWO2_02_FULL_49_13]|uniref:Polymerase beta nucleotidyltransferase domain-containing protein n=1 Tax=Candidatus Doudnabacteria bacterium RIFCSPHIGHO2_12_FULL_48_16 TaxID=1817838 RepID=A0A1F5PIP5_9BACT|nr:MAG: hypothetical protein A3B77_00175 [Candidatus Doudnabacteria bacterium RIFCSPHIGHO2_02_FULL_49_24]OGE89545.1 MAG: hypothetical protein A2760_03435 [Candidatus Doudnabacteria bacterium RIFCSPHIGHO2_01_FULL_50_67]OGE89796.1 MAG: hypothetical protein A3E29_00205 [Candidatus Doudnabacteria bacterium RIFCSPHIGHO2_12_FULL_48_16]OGE97700.1 MAG: hypothetical protein A2990_00685 [Candidatus Doudnabacteria bacterium RIFCSPLOWO2_01_FULL_49_40]OGF02799.1 MAG: hypothetical protein A3J07_00285 [Candid
MRNQLSTVVEKLNSKFHPVSIFLYGSRAKGDYQKHSDYEIGILFHDNEYVHRKDIQKHCPAKFNVFPFRLSEFLIFKSDIPFQEKIFFKELRLTAQTLRGQDIRGIIREPAIATINLVEEVRFLMGRALSAITTFRDYDEKTAKHLFYKSCLFGFRALIIHTQNKFPINYHSIYLLSKRAKILPAYKKLISDAYKVRLGFKLKERDLYTNISFLNYVLRRLKG